MLDLLLTHGRIIDPASGLDTTGAVGIRAGRISGIYTGQVALPAARETLDTAGRVITAGFIDLHAHADLPFLDEDYTDPRLAANTTTDRDCAERLLAQGVTTMLNGNCSFSPVDVAGYIAGCGRTAVNQRTLVGHGALRFAAGCTDKHAAATPEHIARMCDAARAAYTSGAAGVSFGVGYTPGAAFTELLALTQTAADAGRIAAIHTRTQGCTPAESVTEPCELALQTGARVQISHLVYQYTGAHLRRAIEIITDYRARGADITVDSGMYTDWATFAGSALFEDSARAVWDWDYADMTAFGGIHDGKQMTRRLFIEARREPKTVFIVRVGNPDDIRAAYELAECVPSTDVGPAALGGGHPQGSATFPKFLREIVADAGQFDLIEGLRRCSTYPARILGLHNKGRVAAGADADLVVLDLERLRPVADFPPAGNPVARPNGVTHVIVNGRLAIRDETRIAHVNAGHYVY
ncbi:MAG: amidohydrolase family protein [Actinomycetes bacterium]|jgi:N-acyl-D-amino-acid deacylase|nr:amidohydrolase family protein [Actinomycetes bacterium]